MTGFANINGIDSHKNTLDQRVLLPGISTCGGAVGKGPCIVRRNEVRGQARMNGGYCCLPNIWSVQLALRAV